MELHFNFLKPQDVRLISNSAWTVIFDADTTAQCALASSKDAAHRKGSSFSSVRDEATGRRQSHVG